MRKRIGHYHIDDLLGHGASAAVYLGRYRETNEQVAIKLFHLFMSEEQVQANFRREVEALQRLKHPQIIQILDVDFDEEYPYFTMPYVSGGSLRAKYPKGKQIPLRTVQAYLQQLASALQHAHDNKVIHLDIKPENILVTPSDQLLLSDFGIARIIHTSRSLTTQETGGTLVYKAPEQFQGKPCPESDQYSLAITIYEWLCGKPPFLGSAHEHLLNQHLFDSPPPLRDRNSNITEQMEHVVLRALAKKPAERFPDIQAFSVAFSKAVEEVHPKAGSINLSSPNRLSVGTTLSGARYTIESLLAQGGRRTVYRATDTRFNRPCAVKEMLDEFRQESERADAIKWFEREATLLLDLNHPYIPHIHDFFADGGKNYLVMDFVDGYTLAQMLELEGNVKGLNGASGITEARAQSWTRQICSVLSYLHRQNPPIIFRDLKPSNIMITKQDEIKLIDFGIARTFQSQTQATVIMTIGYAPPEQLSGMPEPRSDLFALGATMHRLLTRHDAVNNKPSVFSFPFIRSLRPDVSAAFDQIIMQALAPNIEQRWSSADEMERAVLNLSRLLATPPVLQPGVSGASVRPQRIVATPNVVQSGSGPTSEPAESATHTTTGPAGSHIQRAFTHLAAVPPRLDAAYSEVIEAFSLESNNSLVHKIFGQIFARRTPPDVDNSMNAYNRSLQLYFDDAETHKLVGDVTFSRSNYSQAITAYDQSMRLNPNDFEVRERLGQCYEKTNQPEVALREYQEAIRLVSLQPQAGTALPRIYFALGQVARRLNQLPVAENAFVQVLFQNPSDHQTRFLLCLVYEEEGKLEDAFRECGYVVRGPLANNGSVQQVYKRLKDRLGR